jgi:hypothetical protein
MPKFRKKPVVIEARRFDRGAGTRLAKWCGGRYESRYGLPPQLFIPTLEGTMRAQVGDWIVKGVAGEFYPVAPSIFEASYEEGEDG